MQKLAKNSENTGFIGKYRITKFNSETGAVLSQSEWYKNIVVSSNGHGRNLIGRQMVGDSALSIVIDEMSLSNNNTAPTNADTSLGGDETRVGVDLLTLSTAGQANVITFSAFFTDNDLPNDTYHKVGVYLASNRLFTSAMLPVSETKESGENYRVDYQITIN